MWKLPPLTLLLLLCVFLTSSPPPVQSFAAEPEAVEEWFKNLDHTKQQVSKFHFYFHDIVSGKNPTVVQVAKAKTTSKSPTFFGAVVVLDDPFTTGPEPNSKVVARAQGIYALDGLEDSNLLMAFNIVFTDGEYNGSTLSVLGHNPVFHEYREMPIIGGSGVFRLARGIATAKTYFYNLTSGDTVVEYHVVALHY